MITQLLSISRRVARSVGVFMSTIFAKFIFAATLPALPFFLTMGASYSIIKYGAFKIRKFNKIKIFRKLIIIIKICQMIYQKRLL